LPVPIYKTTYFFFSGDQGFSESWYITALNITSADNVANGAMLLARQQILGNSTYIGAVRTVDTNAPGNALLTLISAPPAGNPNLNRDNASNAIQVRAFSADFYRRTMWLRSIPDFWITYNTGGQAIPNQLAQQAVSNFLAKAGAVGVGLRVISTTAAQNQPIQLVNFTIPNAAPFNILYTTTVAHGYIVGQYIRINQMKGDYLRAGPPYNYSLNGIFQIVAVPSATTFTTTALSTDWGTLIQPVYFSGGLVRGRWRVDNAPPGTTSMPSVVDGHVMRYSRRKPGRAFFVPAGRQKGTKRW
jgi:hypothetical protein